MLFFFLKSCFFNCRPILKLTVLETMIRRTCLDRPSVKVFFLSCFFNCRPILKLKVLETMIRRTCLYSPSVKVKFTKFYYGFLKYWSRFLIAMVTTLWKLLIFMLLSHLFPPPLFIASFPSTRNWSLHGVSCKSEQLLASGFPECGCKDSEWSHGLSVPIRYTVEHPIPEFVEDFFFCFLAFFFKAEADIFLLQVFFK